MYNSHLIEIMKTLQPEEVERFKEYMFSRSNNASTEQIEAQNLLNYLLGFYPDFNSNELSKESTFNNIYINKIFVEGKIDKLLVIINKSLRHFLLIQKYLDESNEFQQLLDLSEIYKTRGLNARYHQTINQLYTQFIKNKKHSYIYLLNEYRFEYEKHDWASMYNRQSNDLNLPNTIKALYYFYKTQMLELLNRFTLQQWANKIEIPDYINDIKKSINLQSPEINKQNELHFIQEKINKIITDSSVDPQEMDSITLFMDEHAEKFDSSIKQTLYTYLRNICTILLDRGSSNLRSNLFNLQKSHLERGYLFHNGKITALTYISIAYNAVCIKKFEWVINFINEYKDKLIGEDKDNAYFKLNMALYLFETKDYEKSLCFLTFGFQETQLVVMSRRIELKAFYELRSELIDFKVDAYKMFINRISHKTFPIYRKEPHLNFTNIFSQIVQSIRGDKARAQKIIKRILAKKLVVDRDWLLEKARELGNLSDDEYAEAIKNPPTKE